MQEKLLKQTAFLTVVFSIVATGLMVWFQMNREELLRLDNQIIRSEQHANYEEVVSVDAASGFIPINVDQTDRTNTVMIHFTSALPSEIETGYDYANKNMEVFIPQITGKDMQTCQVSVDEKVVDMERIRAIGQIRNGESGVLFCMPLKGYFEGELSVEGTDVQLHLSEILPGKELTVVLDAGHGGTDSGDTYQDIAEKDLNRIIINMVKEQLEKEDMRVYCTRNGDSTASEQARIDFANAIRADIFVSVQYSFLTEGTVEKKSGLTAIYNGRYFIPDFGSIELANIMSEETIKKVGGVANGMYEAADVSELISNAHVPATLIEIDNVLTDANKVSLTSDKNLKRIAEGISSGIIKAKENFTE